MINMISIQSLVGNFKYANGINDNENKEGIKAREKIKEGFIASPQLSALFFCINNLLCFI